MSNKLIFSILGTVSSGKSTMLNSIFCKELSQSSIKRTTMEPIIFSETLETDYDLEKSKSIHSEIKNINLNIVKKTETGVKRQICNEKHFDVGKIDIKIMDKSLIDIIDVPGLNDARTKDIYFDYLNNNFFKFNVIIFLVDIHSGLNTSDEMDILKLIVDNTKKQLLSANRKIYTLVIVNKCDDLQIKLEKGKEILYLDDELHEMFEQVNLTTRSEFEKANISEHLIDIIHMSALDSYLYRMIDRYGSTYQLKDADMLKIGINNCGRSFGKKSKELQYKEVEKIINDKDFVKDMIKMSGFSGLESVLYDFLETRKIGNELLISNIEFNLAKLKCIIYYIQQNDMIELNIAVGKYNSYFQQIKEIDEENYIKSILEFISELHEGYGYIISSMSQIDIIKEYYDKVNTLINKIFFSEFMDTEKYPSYVTDKILTILQKYFSESIIDIDEFIKIIYCLCDLDLFKTDVIQQLLSVIMDNIHTESTLALHKDCFAPLIKILTKISDELVIDLTVFMRFIIINLINSQIFSYDELVVKKMIYMKYNEISIQSYLNLYLIKSYDFSEYKVFLKGLNKSDISDKINSFDMFYILYEKLKIDF